MLFTPAPVCSPFAYPYNQVWRTSTSEFVRTLHGHRRGIACLQYKGQYVVSGSSDNTIRWEEHRQVCSESSLEVALVLFAVLHYVRTYSIWHTYDVSIPFSKRNKWNDHCFRTGEKQISHLLFRVRRRLSLWMRPRSQAFSGIVPGFLAISNERKTYPPIHLLPCLSCVFW